VHESCSGAFIEKLSLCGAMDKEDVDPFTAELNSEALRHLRLPRTLWEEPVLEAYTLCVAWTLSDVKNVIVDVLFGLENFASAPRKYTDIDFVVAPTFIGASPSGHWALLTIDKNEKSVSILGALDPKKCPSTLRREQTVEERIYSWAGIRL
jgi:hypothetical protein